MISLQHVLTYSPVRAAHRSHRRNRLPRRVRRPHLSPGRPLSSQSRTSRARLWALAQDPGRQLHELKPGQTVNAWAYEHEVAHAKGIIDAAAKVEGLKRFVWPSLTAAREISRGRYTWAYHFDSKANAAEYMKREYPELWAKTSRVQVRFYATNHSSLPFMRPQKVRPLAIFPSWLGPIDQ
jgi:hypothetical protein